MDTNDVIACRELNKGERTYNVLIQRPYCNDEGNYVCDWSLVDDSSSTVIAESVEGVDSVQALLLAFLIIGERLAFESDHFTFLGFKDTGFLRVLDSNQKGGPFWYLPLDEAD